MVSDLTGGSTDSDLTEPGQRLAGELKGRPLHLGSGPLTRAQRTAGIIGEALGVEAQIYPELTDLRTGAAAGMNRDQAPKIFVPPSEPILEWRPNPQAENWNEFARHVRGFMDAFQSEKLSILVAHRAVIENIVAWWLGLPVDSGASFDFAPASLSVVCINYWGERTLERLNDSAHLHAAGMPDPLRL
jgi:probable phosphoglycerate mutase